MNIRNSYHVYGLEARGEGMLCVSDLEYYIRNDMLNNPLEDGFELSQGVTDVEAGFFDYLPHLKHIMVAPSVRSIGVSEKTKEIFARNDTYVSGEFDTYAETFAGEQGICFVHENFELASSGDYFKDGVDIITLRMFPDGTARLHQDCRCQGISASSMGGGECDVPLPDDFYLTHSPKNIADLCWGSCYSGIMKCEKLKKFLKEAKRKKGFCLRFK